MIFIEIVFQFLIYIIIGISIIFQKISRVIITIIRKFVFQRK